MKVPGILFDCARRSSTDSLDLVLAEQFLKDDEWGKAVKSIQRALKKTNADKAGKAFMLLGHAYLKQDQVKLARAAFVKASEFPEYRAKAEYWLDNLAMKTDNYWATCLD